MTATPPKSPLWAGACWPVPIWKGEVPEVSDGFSRHVEKDPRHGAVVHRQHLGVDIMYRNKKSMPPKIPRSTLWYHCDDDVPMLAMLAGEVWHAGFTATGGTVKIDHGARYGFPLVTYYTHMSKLLVRKGHPVIAGTPIGVIGNSPAATNDPNHAHVELWDYSKGQRERVDLALDPFPYLKTWPKLPARMSSSGAYQVGATAATK